MKEFGQRLKYYRKQAGFTQEELAEKLKISSKQYQNYEQGKSYPLMNKFITLCQIIDVPADFLLSDKARNFQDYSSLYIFNKLREEDDAESTATFHILQKLLECKNMDKNQED